MTTSPTTRPALDVIGDRNLELGPHASAAPPALPLPALGGERVGVRGASTNARVSDSRRDPLTPTLSP